MSTARDNPIATAAAVGGAVAAGVFLWSRRNQISDQISNLADQISEWREGGGSDSEWMRRRLERQRAVHGELGIEFARRAVERTRRSFPKKR